MKTIAISGAVIAALAAGAFATPTFAQPYGGGYYDYRSPCQEKTHESGTTGAILGGLAGAAIGNNIGRSSAHSSVTCEGGYGYRTGYSYRSYEPYRAPVTYERPYYDRTYYEPHPERVEYRY